MNKIIYYIIVFLLLSKEIHVINISNKHNDFTREIMRRLFMVMNKQWGTDVFSLNNYQENLDYSAIIFKKRSFTNNVNIQKKILIRGIKGKVVNELHVRSFLSMLISHNMYWGEKIIIIHEKRAVIRNQARINQDIVFISNLYVFPYLNSLKRNFNKNM